MRKATFKYIESELFNFNLTKKEIKVIEYDSMFTRENVDENIGGGKNNIISSPIESVLFTLEKNKKYNHMKKVVNAIQYVYDHANDEQQKLLHMRYWSNRKYTWTGIATRLNISERKALYMRKKLIEDIGERLGYV